MFNLQLIKKAWDQANVSGEILWRADTLQMRQVDVEGIKVEIIYNSVRDAYDGSVKTIDLPQVLDDPFAHNPLLAETEAFKLYGNPFSCMQYQCILVPRDVNKPLGSALIRDFTAVAEAMPELRILYNGLGAGKTVPNEFTLMSLHDYPGLFIKATRSVLSRAEVGIVSAGGAYRLVFPLDPELLWTLCDAGHPFNFLLHDGLVTFIPRKPIEAPLEPSYRFGGLEMIGTFVVKSREQFDAANAALLWQAAASVCLDERERTDLEKRLEH
jgi:hypothetical protein